MKKALIIAKWEFLCTVKRPGYLITVLALPLFYGGMFGLSALATRSASATAGLVPTAVVDSAHILDLDFAARQAGTRARIQAGDLVAAAMEDRSDSLQSAAAATAAMTTASSTLVLYASIDEATAALRRREVAAVFAVDEDYMTTGKITAVSRDAGLFAQQGDQRRQGQVADAIRASLMHQSMDGDRLARAYAPAVNIARMRLTARGVEPASDPYGLGPMAGSFGIVLLLTISIFFSAAFLQQATIADRQNKTIEVLLSSVDSDELLAGKLIGLGGAGLLQVGIYVALIIVPGATLLSLFQVPAARLLLSLLYYVIGISLFASLMAGTGMLGRSPQQGAQLSALWTMSAASPFFFFANIGTAPNGAIARALSFFPLTSPVTMIMRIGGGDVPLIDVGISTAIDAVAIYFVLRAASRIFRAATLMHGNRATLPEFLRWFKAA